MTERQMRVLRLLYDAEGFPGASTNTGELKEDDLRHALEPQGVKSRAEHMRTFHRTVTALRRRGLIHERDDSDGTRRYRLADLGRKYF